MDSRYTRWLALSVFALLIALWLAAALHLTGASAGRPGFPFDLQSRLAADYGADGGDRISSLRISIIADFLQDLGLGGSGPSVVGDLDSPVPTATARNFEGDPPFTPTAMPSPIPSETNVPTADATVTPTTTATAFASKTPTPSKTPKPEDTELPTDDAKPSLSGGSLFPSAGTMLPTCNGNDVAVTGLRVVDPAFSSGIRWVKLKYKILGPGSLGYIYSEDIGPPVSGGWKDGPGSKWDAYYKGDLTIDFDAAYALELGGGKTYARPLAVVVTDTPEPATATPEPPTATPPPATATPTAGPVTATPEPDPFTVEVWVIVRDQSGNESYDLLGSYLLPGSCGE